MTKQRSCDLSLGQFPIERQRKLNEFGKYTYRLLQAVWRRRLIMKGQHIYYVILNIQHSFSIQYSAVSEVQMASLPVAYLFIMNLETCD